MERTSFSNREGIAILPAMIEIIEVNHQYLSDIDGLIGDGDHGINMNKGFQIFKNQLAEQDPDMSNAFRMLADVLMEQIGGSMGPLYGSFFMAMGRTSSDSNVVNAEVFLQMLTQAELKVKSLGECAEGDKTILDVLAPARRAFKEGMNVGFAFALNSMVTAAEKGREATVEMVARKGRSSRLGERSRGVPDAGASSCYLLLKAMAHVICELLETGDRFTPSGVDSNSGSKS